MSQCFICQKEYKNNISLSNHISRGHKIRIKDYYDKYLKKENDGICLHCGQKTNFSGIGGYYKFCCIDCISKSSILQKKRKQTWLQKYGVDNPSKFQKFQDKKIQTNIIKYGTTNYNKSKEAKERYKKICIEKYGVDNVFKSKEIKELIKQTNLKKFGCENPSQNKDLQNKKIQTSLKNYGVEYPNQSNIIKEKRKNTCILKYGVDFPLQVDQIKEKGRETCFRKYGVKNWSQTTQGKLNHRITSVKYRDLQLYNKEPIMPRIGKIERLFLDTLQFYSSYKIIRNDLSFRYIIGRFPDGHIPELKLFIQFDERYHFKDKSCKIYTDDDENCTAELGSMGYLVFRVSELEWKNNKYRVIEQFKSLISLSQNNLLVNKEK